jgi:hypothetical protein
MSWYMDKTIATTEVHTSKKSQNTRNGSAAHKEKHHDGGRKSSTKRHAVPTAVVNMVPDERPIIITTVNSSVSQVDSS